MTKKIQWIIVPCMVAIFTIASGCTGKKDHRKDHGRKKQHEQNQKKQAQKRTHANM